MWWQSALWGNNIKRHVVMEATGITLRSRESLINWARSFWQAYFFESEASICNEWLFPWNNCNEALGKAIRRNDVRNWSEVPLKFPASYFLIHNEWRHINYSGTVRILSFTGVTLTLRVRHVRAEIAYLQTSVPDHRVRRRYQHLCTSTDSAECYFKNSHSYGLSVTLIMQAVVF